MRWMGGRRSDNVEDRRGMGVPLVAGGGIGTIVLLVLALFFGFDPSVILQGGDGTPPPVTQAPAPSASPRGGDEVRDFVATVLADTEDTWGALFRDMGRQYRQPKLVLFNTAVQSACGMAGSATGSSPMTKRTLRRGSALPGTRIPNGWSERGEGCSMLRIPATRALIWPAIWPGAAGTSVRPPLSI